MEKILHESLSIKQLKAKFQEQIFAIPEIQRNYVWDVARVCKLLDSIYHHFPVGVALVWRTKSEKSVEIRPDNKTIIPAFNINNSNIEFIIDGQQRLSSLYGILSGKQGEGKTKTDFTKIYFQLKKEDKIRFLYSNKLTQNSEGYVRLYDILNVQPAVLARRFKLNALQSKELKKCSERINTYRFHFLTIHTNSLEEVRETFIRINSQGMTVQRADTLFAKTTKIGLKDLVEATRRSLIKSNFNKLDPKYFIYTLALASGETRISGAALDSFHKKFEQKNIGRKEFAKTWKSFHNAFTMTSDFLLQEYGVTNLDLLPSSNIFTMLAFFFHSNKNRRPSAVQKREIKKWFWHTVFGERYSGLGFGKNIPDDVKFFKRLSRSYAAYSISERIDPWDLLKSDYRKIKTSTSVSGYFLYLRSKKPRYLENGELMLLDGAASIANRKDRHHIFPQNLLRQKQVNPKWIHSIANICLLAANENQSISDHHPKRYLEPYSKSRFFSRVTKSHFIPCGPEEGVWNSNVKIGFIDFLNRRGQSLIREIEKDVLGSKGKLFESFQPIKKL